MQGRRRPQRHAVAAEVDGRAPQVRCRICLTEQGRELGGAPEVTPALACHEIVRRIQHSSNFLGIYRSLEDKICTLAEGLMPVRSVSCNRKHQCVSVAPTLPYPGQDSQCLGNGIEIHEYRFVLRLPQLIGNAVNCGASLCRDPEFSTDTTEMFDQPRVRRNQESADFSCVNHFTPLQQSTLVANSIRLRPARFAAYSAASASLRS